MSRAKTAKRIQIKRITVVWWTAASVVVALWMFVLGVWVGQGGLSGIFEKENLPGWAKGLWRTKGSAPKVRPRLLKPKLDYYDRLQKGRPKPAPAPDKKTVVKPPPRPKPKPPAKPAVRTGAYTIQLASVATAEQAESVRKRFAKQGLTAYVVRVKLPGLGVRYRVRAGNFRTLAAARASAAKLRRRGVGSVLVVRLGN